MREQKTIIGWIREKFKEHDEHWLYQNLAQCAFDLQIVSINSETYSRQIRAVKRELSGISEPITDSTKVNSLSDSIEFHDIDFTKLDIKELRTGTWGSGTNPNKQVRVTYKPKDYIFDPLEAIREFKAEIASYKPTVKSIKRNFTGETYAYEMAFPDVHASLLAWAEETGVQDYDLKIFTNVLIASVDELLQRVSHVRLDKIFLLFNGDIFNSDGLSETTTKGTKQSNDSRWQKAYSVTWRVIRDVINYCKNIADVEVVITQGNHDEAVSYYLGETIGAWFEDDPNVTIDNSPRVYKYKTYGDNLIGITHGHGAKMVQLPGIMATDVPQLWGLAKNREFHMGHFHGELSHEYSGCITRVFRALSPPSDWTILSGFRSVPASQAILWDKKLGNVTINTAYSFK